MFSHLADFVTDNKISVNFYVTINVLGASSLICGEWRVGQMRMGVGSEGAGKRSRINKECERRAWKNCKN